MKALLKHKAKRAISPVKRVDIPTKLHSQLKAYAASNNLFLQDLVASAIEEFLSNINYPFSNKVNSVDIRKKYKIELDNNLKKRK